MIKETRVGSNFGPVDVQLVLCDNPECHSQAQEKYAVGWFHLETFGVEVRTISQPDPDTHYCSIECLSQNLKSYMN